MPTIIILNRGTTMINCWDTSMTKIEIIPISIGLTNALLRLLDVRFLTIITGMILVKEINTEAKATPLKPKVLIKNGTISQVRSVHIIISLRIIFMRPRD